MEPLRPTDRKDGRQTSLRRISFEGVSAKKKQHIVNEVNTLTSLNYPHLLRYYDYNINRQEVTVDITVEKCEGGTLQDLICQHRRERRPMEEGQIWDYFYQLAQALEFVHSNNVLHRDLNPQHVLFKDSKQKHVKLAGFGQAKTLDTESQFGSTVLPNTHYLSPEQVEDGTTTTHTDVWGLGCLIYEMARLQAPFHHPNEFERVRMIRQQPPKKLSYYSLQLNRVLLLCLNKKPEDRPKISELIGCPEISLRLRKRRYEKVKQEIESKERRLRRREEELRRKESALEREEEMLRTGVGIGLEYDSGRALRHQVMQ